TSRFHELAQTANSQPKYISPYPSYNGRLGYFPSFPAPHIKCVEAASTHTVARLTYMKQRIQALTYERNKYRKSYEEWTAATLDPGPGKTREQLIKEENRKLKRESTQLEKKLAEHKMEAEIWKNQFSHISGIYNSLLVEIQLRKNAGLGENIPIVVAPPMDTPSQSIPTVGLPAHQPPSMASYPLIPPSSM